MVLCSVELFVLVKMSELFFIEWVWCFVVMVVCDVI